MSNPITVSTTVSVPVSKAWESWTTPEHIMNWNFASPDWHCPAAKNDPRTGGRFSSTMAARDGSMQFEFEGTYDLVEPLKTISYAMPDGRKVTIRFEDHGNSTTISETFDPESENPADMQRAGWQAILDNYKAYTESLS